ncbi:FeS cluster assembly protein sufD [Sphingobacterium spiritivorum]|uniref:FeS assembly protein SufD n=2 Tax=Sphingobacterium spiritivorum TaxID=258 RepID=D7VIC8_SPHSI|nr:FeS assembly protein SufD [Sphingobacterium spiritivorum ATCC 33861]QQT37529.1 Fe-S cluster assembly protein SufD [Sphingobacterium spiritivorum]SUI97162.1 FeS cluster assembly protein sufD [Sphingobacterium spiritivorum]
MDEVASRRIDNNMSTLIADSLFQQLVDGFQEQKNASETVALTKLRQDAFDKFRQVGFPTVKNEDWKYTNVHSLVNKTYVLNPDVDIDGLDFSKADIPDLDAHRIILVNGQYVLAFSSLEEEIGLTVKPIDDAAQEGNFSAHFAQYADKTQNPFVALNTALYTSGLYIDVAKGKALQKPIHIVHVATGAEDFFTQTRNLIVLEPNAEAEIIESFITLDGSAKNVQNKVTEIVVQENAKLQHYYLQVSASVSHYLNHTEVYQEKYSLYNNYNCNFPGASFVRNDINVRLDAEYVESHLYGINLTADNQFVDNHTVVDHMKPHCESYEWYKNIPQDTSTAVFNGKIFVREDAQKTNAFQQNNNMLIGDKSTVYTKPQLEIFADDVKCSHGCTMGQFDNDALFYLRARGIGEESARLLLVHAFAFDVTTRFSNPVVRQYVENLVDAGLRD